MSINDAGLINKDMGDKGMNNPFVDGEAVTDENF